MSNAETFFPINDLLRRKLQTGLVIAGLALCVASTLFVLSLSGRTGFGALATNESKLTAGFAVIFSQFIILAEILVFAVGIVTISFLVHTMMSERTKDIGLMKAAGCPNDVVFSYFMTELVIVTLASCSLGVIIGTVVDYAASNFLGSIGLEATQWQINPLAILVTFVAFVVLSLIVGARPILAATRVKPAVALSPSFYFGLSRESDFKGIAKAGLTAKMAVRSLFRRKSTSFQILLCLTIVFILVTVSVAGGIIADQTTTNWVERAVGKNVLLIANREMTSQYESLMSKFYTGLPEPQFNYTDQKYLAPDELLANLSQWVNLKIDPRLVITAQVDEVQGIILGETTGETTTVGDHREGTSLIVGVEPENVVGNWYLSGNFLTTNQDSSVVIGDTLAATMFSQPLSQSLMLSGRTFQIAGVCLDPINNGNVTYVPLETLQGITAISRPNIIMVEITDQANRMKILDQLNRTVNAIDPEFEVSQLNVVLDKQSSFLNYLWSEVMLLPLLSLVAATLCMVGYVTLVIDEQRDEYGILRAVGARPGTVVKIVMAQNSLILLSSWAVGLALGIITTVLILIPEPYITGTTILEISAWLFAALAVLLFSSLYPALRFVRKPAINIMLHH
ncbi:MAG TPA: FtsX-like permease family protein [Candidatus Acidoferrum sp.]|nr:FtsX-like permease family protein [Candidatus Acidoferrum sp.]